MSPLDISTAPPRRTVAVAGREASDIDGLGKASPQSRLNRAVINGSRRGARAEVVRCARLDGCLWRCVCRRPAADGAVLVRLPVVRHCCALPRRGAASFHTALVVDVHCCRCCQPDRTRLGVFRTHPLERVVARLCGPYSSPQHRVAAAVRCLAGSSVRAESSHPNRTGSRRRGYCPRHSQAASSLSPARETLVSLAVPVDEQSRLRRGRCLGTAQGEGVPADRGTLRARHRIRSERVDCSRGSGGLSTFEAHPVRPAKLSLSSVSRGKRRPVHLIHTASGRITTRAPRHSQVASPIDERCW